MSTNKILNGRLVSVVEVKGGWTTVLDGMKQIKVRNSELSDPKPDAKPTAAKKATTKAEPAPKPTKPDRTADDGADARLVKPDTSRYVVSDDVKTASGRKAIDTGDDVATELRGMDLGEVYKLASRELGVTQKELHEKYDHLNPGMQRMNMGNRIRGVRAAAAREAEKAAAKS